MAEHINKEKMKAENKQYSEKEKNEEETLKTLRKQGYRVSSPCFCEMLKAGTAKDGTHPKEYVSTSKEDHEHERRLLEQLGSEKGRKKREVALKEGKCPVCSRDDPPKNRHMFCQMHYKKSERHRHRTNDPICDIASLFQDSERFFSAKIETLLKKEGVTLFELMDEDELLQECKAQNRKLVYFLTQAKVLDEMVYLVVNEPSAEGEMQMRFKYANLAAELLTADVPAIIDKLVASTSLLDILYKFLEKEKPLNPLLASFFSKVLGMLVQRRSEQVLDFLKSKGDFVELAVQHVGTSAIMDLLLKLICNVEEDEIRQRVHQWLNEGQLVERLVDKLSPDADSEDHASADNLLCEISTYCRDTSTDGHQQTNPLLATLKSEDIVNKLLDLLLHEDWNDSSLSHVINILLTLLSARTQQQQIQHQQQQQQGLQQYASVDSSDCESSDGRKNAVARIIAKRLPSLQNILLHPPKKGLLLPAYGQEVEPLGNTRLQVVTLVAALFAVSDPVVHDSLYELNTVEYLLDLFFQFMLNHFLHTQVEQCLTAILTKAPAASSPEGDTDYRLLTQLFNDGRIIERVLAAFDESSERQECKQIHMGHLRQLANSIVQQAEFGPNEHHIKQLIQGLPGDKATQWDDFVSNALAELNRKNEITPLPGFKEMDIDVIGDFHYADDEFKGPDDNLSDLEETETGTPDKEEAEDKDDEELMENFNILSSLGLMKMSSENAGISEAGTTPPIPSENDEQTSESTAQS